jgi:hypothetical protein
MFVVFEQFTDKHVYRTVYNYDVGSLFLTKNGNIVGLNVFNNDP